LEFPGLDFADLDFADFGFPACGPADLVFADFSVEDLDFGIAVTRPGAVARFAVFRPRLTIRFPVPQAKSLANPDVYA
jgi:hypothetical protein